MSVRRSSGVHSLKTVQLPGLFRCVLNIGGTGKRRVDGQRADSRLGKSVTSQWLNERFRQTFQLLREFHINWNEGKMLHNDDLEYLRVALDVTLDQMEKNDHVADDYDANPTLWAMWLIQHLHVVKAGDWTVETPQEQLLFSLRDMYAFLALMHNRGDVQIIRDPMTKQITHRYRLPFKANMVVPPKPNQMFRWRKAAQRLSDFMEAGGLPPLHKSVIAHQPPTIRPPMPNQAARDARRDALWHRVTQRAARRNLQSVRGTDEDSAETRSVISGLMGMSRDEAARDAAPDIGLTEEEAAELEAELTRDLEAQQVDGDTGAPSLADSQVDFIQAFLLGDDEGTSTASSSSTISAYEQQRLLNIARNHQRLAMLGLDDAASKPPGRRQRQRDPFPPGRSGAAPTRQSSRGGTAGASTSYEESDSSEDSGP